MSAGKYDFSVEAGASFSRAFRCKDAGGAPIDITGASISMMARTSYDAASPTLSLSTSGGQIVLTDPDAGEFTVTISAEATTALGYTRETKLVYDIERTMSDVTARLLQGALKITPEVTR